MGALEAQLAEALSAKAKLAHDLRVRKGDRLKLTRCRDLLTRLLPTLPPEQAAEVRQTLAETEIRP